MLVRISELICCRKRVEKQIKDTQEKSDKLRTEVRSVAVVDVEDTDCKQDHTGPRPAKSS